MLPQLHKLFQMSYMIPSLMLIRASPGDLVSVICRLLLFDGSLPLHEFIFMISLQSAYYTTDFFVHELFPNLTEDFMKDG